ncbi:MAG: hypothetical protein K5787_15485 [Lentisphaeria bacterium]|nr:hypothetical protein [Victivallales bacterium]MCR4575161.1 hypothetical protein [Lentisphaeria bacterium]
MPLDNILISLFLLLLPLVLWKCKNTCEKHPSTIAFRSVPLGCLSMLLLPTFAAIVIGFLYDLYETNPANWTNIIYDWILHPLSIAIGIAVIVHFSKRFSKGRERPSFGVHAAVFVASLVISVIISLACLPIQYKFSSFASKSWYKIYLPNLGDVHVAFEQRPSHPFLAEYDYRLRLRHGKEQRYFALFPNTGGRTFINVYKLPGDKLFLKDTHANYLVDAADMQVYLLETTDGSPHAVPLSEKAFTSIGTSPTGGAMVHFKDGTHAMSIPLAIDLQEKTYIGCIMDYSFYTPDKQPEGEGHPKYREKD